MVILRRRVDDLELLIRNLSPIFAIKYEGNIDKKLLTRAFEILYIRHPVLRGRICRDPDGYLLHVDEDYSPSITELSGTVEDLLKEAPNSPHYTSGLARLIVVERERVGYIALQVNHMFFDGYGILAKLRELWEIYTALTDYSEIDVEPGKNFPPPFSKLIPNSFISISSSNDKSNIEYPNPLQRRILLTREDTELLVRAGRRFETSVHGIVCGVILVGMRTSLRPLESAPMLCYSQVNARRLVVPPIDPQETRGPGFYHKSIVPVSAGQDAISVGREVKKQLAIDVPRWMAADRLPDPRELFPESPEQRYSGIRVNNLGNVAKLAQAANVDPVDLLLLPEYEFDPGCRNVFNQSFPIFFVSTYDGRLSIRAIFPADIFSEKDLDAITSCLSAELHKASAQ